MHNCACQRTNWQISRLAWHIGDRAPAPGQPAGREKKRDLLSLIGVLHHAAKVIKPGRTFVRSLIDASMTVKSLDHHVHLNARARADITWWHLFAQSWNGTSILPPQVPGHCTYSDASGSWGAGALWGKEWFHFQWPASWADAHISPKEMAPIVVAVAIWGSNWAGERVCRFSDNMAVVYAINKGSAKDPQLSRLLRLLFFFTAAHGVTIVARHVPGEDNTLADAISRNKLPLFHSLYPQAHPQQAAVPHTLQQLVLEQ